MHVHCLRSFLFLLLSNSAIAQILTFPQSSLPQGQNVTVHWALTGGETPGSFQLRLREIEPTARVIDQQSVANTPGAEDVTFNTGILELGEYIAEIVLSLLGSSIPLFSSTTLTVVAPLPSATVGPTSTISNELTSSTAMTTSGSVSNLNSNQGSTPISVSGSTSISASSTQPTNSPVTSNTTKTALLPTSSSFSDQLQSSELQPSSTSGVDSDTTDPPVPASSLNKRSNALPVVLAVVSGLVAVGVIVFIVRCRRRRRSSLNMTPEPLPLVIDHRISESSFGSAARSRTSEGFTRSSSLVSPWQLEEKVPPSLFINTFATTSSASQLNSSSDRHETPPEEASTANAMSPVTIAPSPVFTSPASLAPSAAAHVNERLLEVQWWRSQFAAVDDDTGTVGAPPRYPGSVARVKYTEVSGTV